MTIQELQLLLSNSKFHLKEDFNSKYTFNYETFHINGAPITKYRLIEENNIFYMITDERLGDENILIIMIVRENYPIELSFTFKTTSKYFITIVEE